MIKLYTFNIREIFAEPARTLSNLIGPFYADESDHQRRSGNILIGSNQDLYRQVKYCADVGHILGQESCVSISKWHFGYHALPLNSKEESDCELQNGAYEQQTEAYERDKTVDAQIFILVVEVVVVVADVKQTSRFIQQIVYRHTRRPPEHRIFFRKNVLRDFGKHLVFQCVADIAVQMSTSFL